MKTLSLLLFVLLIVNVQPEKKLEKEVAYKGQQVIADLDFASDIELKTWKKSAIKIVASVKMEDEKYKELYELKLNSSDSNIEICSNSVELIEAYHDEFGKRNDLKQEINYTLFVPEGVEMELSSITGSLTSEFLQGNIRIDLVVGDVNIEKFKGNLELKSVTGKIDLPVKDSSYKAKTVMGNIHGYDPAAARKKGLVGQEVTKDLQDSENQLSLSTVTGDIYLN
ncbi:DUF4097 family beta strand repeat-containing protein [Salinimicrobium xinjiangense]|uniref:hypothetical protein n=1 Tax=Salinimicrobium xinjiangense TaxID=438596 RepID=UPI00041A30AD|nr:hypothetical protein [Salinimicrobium xinjiangense]